MAPKKALFFFPLFFVLEKEFNNGVVIFDLGVLSLYVGVADEDESWS